MLVVVVDDEEQIRSYLTKVLRLEHHEVITFGDALTAFDHIRANPPADVYLIDYKLPHGANGLTLSRQIRDLHKEAVIILISQVAKEREIIEAFWTAGVDDVILKPIDSAHLLARMSDNLLRRRMVAMPPRQDEAEVIQSGALTLNLAGRTATWCGEELHLTPTELLLLFHMVIKAGQAIGYGELYALAYVDRVVGPSVASKWCKTHIANLRQKLDRVGQPNPIQTVYAHGFKWQPPGDDALSENISADEPIQKG